MKRLDLTDEQFLHLTVLHRGKNLKEKTAWVCQCVCGSQVLVRTLSLQSGNTTSCGCKHRPNKPNKNRKPKQK